MSDTTHSYMSGSWFLIASGKSIKSLKICGIDKIVYIEKLKRTC